MSAFANESLDSISDSLNEAIEASSNRAYDPFSSPSSKIQLLSDDDADYPSSFDLRYDWKDSSGVQHNIVTPVKNQGLWGTCWAFSAVAASETSLWAGLYNSGNAEAQRTPDFSERAAAWFTFRSIPKQFAGSQVDENGDTEGFHNNSKSENRVFLDGGWMVFVAALYAQGVGPLYEEYAPYKNEEDVVICRRLVKDPENDADPGKYRYVREVHTPEEIAAMTPEERSSLRFYSNTLPDGSPATWSVDDCYYNAAVAELSDGNVLPDPALYNEKGKWQGVNWEGVHAIKDELMDGRAVSMAFYADTSMIGDTGEGKYIKANDDGTWAHWTYDDAEANHAVTIVGWDDTYPKENFVNGGPEADGAWIVKNSWGSETEDFPNHDAWGTVDENGKSTGYFYLSYYDKTVGSLETFDFDVSSYIYEQPEFVVDQHDLLVGSTCVDPSYTAPHSMLSVFTAEYDQDIRSLGCWTTKPGTQVSYEVYLLESSKAQARAGEVSAPVLGEPVYTASESYEYGGYHRLSIDEGQWVPLREGQRYAVKVTETYRGEDGDRAYTVNAMTAEKALTAEEKEQRTAQYEKSKRDEMMRKYYQMAFDALVAKGVAEDEAKRSAQAAAEQYAETDAFKDELKAYVDEYADSLETYYVAVVNPGESYVGVTDDEGNESWVDWSNAVGEIKDKNTVCDNLPIKAFSNMADYADAETLESLSDLVARAKAQLSEYAVSADGKDVSPDKRWVTQEEYDALAKSIADAETMLAGAGDNFNVAQTGTPSQDDADGMIRSLQGAFDAHREQAQPGTMSGEAPDAGGTGDADSSDVVDLGGVTASNDHPIVSGGAGQQDDDGSDAQDAQADQSEALSATGDASVPLVGIVGALCASAGVALLSFRKRSRS